MRSQCVLNAFSIHSLSRYIIMSYARIAAAYRHIYDVRIPACHDSNTARYYNRRFKRLVNHYLHTAHKRGLFIVG